MHSNPHFMYFQPTFINTKNIKHGDITKNTVQKHIPNPHPLGWQILNNNKNTGNNELVRMWGNWNPLAWLVGMKKVQLLWKVCRVLKNLNRESRYAPAIPLLGTYPKEGKLGTQRYLHTRVHSSMIHNSQKVETTQVSMDG